MVQVDKRSHLVLFKQNQRNRDPYTSELQKAYKTDYLANRHNMMGTVSKLYVSNNTWIYVYIKKLYKISSPIPTPESFNSNSNSGKSLEYQLQLQLQLQEFQLQLQLQLRPISRISTPTPTPTPEVSTPIPTPTPELELELNPTPTPTPELTPTLMKTLTHWGRVTHICLSKLTIIGSDNGLSPDRRQAIIWTNTGILLIGPLGTNFIEILIEILTFSFKKMHLKISSAKRRPFCLGLNMLKTRITWNSF